MDAETLLTHLRERLVYDASVGALYRKQGKGFPGGQRLGCKDSAGKLQATFDGDRYRVDRLIWLLETGELTDQAISHINGDNGDDRFTNLKLGRSASKRDAKVRNLGLEAAFKAKAARLFPQHDLTEVEYVNRDTSVRITCSKHGAFVRKPEAYLSSPEGCPTCGKQRHAKTDSERLETQRRYQRANRGIYRAAVKKHKQANKHKPDFRAAMVCRQQLSTVLRVTKQSKTRCTEASLGYTIAEFKSHIENLFEPWMTWANHGKWHVGHRLPVVYFTRQGVFDPRVINALSNLRPLSAFDNMSKHDKMPEQAA